MKRQFLILLRAFHGKSEPILEQARMVGAKGGTVIHSRLRVGTTRHFFPDLEISEEEELVLILADLQTAKAICKRMLVGVEKGQELGSRIYIIPVASAQGLAGHLLTVD
ncbi:MAG TPA: hypothetical protein VLR89_06305 [Anaerolineaceae bacterium]|nr:hypothetical protein [Anaerolineaceae bacterium]